jgi:hypothetical protein
MLIIFNSKHRICLVEPDDDQYASLVSQYEPKSTVVNQSCLKTLPDNQLLAIYNNAYPNYTVEFIKSKRLMIKAIDRFVWNNRAKLSPKKEKSNGKSGHKPKRKM